MKHPPYHLRLNKAVDRLTLIDAIRHVPRLAENISDYTYYGMGGPTLEDFRLIYEFYPEIKMVCIEENEDTYKRQNFHAPCRSAQLELRNMQLKSFLAQYDLNNEKSIFWLDYTGLEYAHFEDFRVLLEKVSQNSVIKITLRCEPSDYLGKDANEASRKKLEFQKEFQDVLPHTSDVPPQAFTDFAKLVQDMVQIAAEKGLPSVMPLKFVPISSFCYADGVGMFTLTGMVCKRTEEGNVRKAFRRWHLANVNWRKPKKIDVPALSTKERLHLQRRLPCDTNAGRVLRRALGYLIESDTRLTEAKLKQYAEFHHYFPYFIKAIP